MTIQNIKKTNQQLFTKKSPSLPLTLMKQKELNLIVQLALFSQQN